MTGDDELGLVRIEGGELDVLVLDVELCTPELPELTAAERGVALLVAEGKSNAEIAAERAVSIRTVANQLRSVFQKLGVGSRWELTRAVVYRSIASPQVRPVEPGRAMRPRWDRRR